MAKPPVPNVKPVRLLPPDICVNCWHPGHAGKACDHNDDYWLDPMVGGDPNNEPRECGCTEFVDQAMRGRIRVVTEDKKVRPPFTPEQINKLRSDRVYDYTCIAHEDSVLVPGIDGMRCPLLGCGYLQAWVHIDEFRHFAFPQRGY